MLWLSQQFRLGLFCNCLHSNEWDRVCVLFKFMIYKCLWYCSIIISMGNQSSNSTERRQQGCLLCWQNSNRSSWCVLVCFCVTVPYVHVTFNLSPHPTSDENNSPEGDRKWYCASNCVPHPEDGRMYWVVGRVICGVSSEYPSSKDLWFHDR